MSRKPTNDNEPPFRLIRPPLPRPSDAHLYKIGQRVRFSAANIDRAATGLYSIEAQLPASYGEQQYRIKSTTSTQERVAQESQLSAADGG